MRPAEIKDEDIIAAGNELMQAGKNVSGFAIRKIVGGGYPARLRQVWDDHVAAKPLQPTEPVVDLPAEVADLVTTMSQTLAEQLMSFATDLNTKAIRAAERRVHDAIRLSNEQREKYEMELADASTSVADLDQQIEEASNRADALDAKCNELQNLNQAQAVSLAQVTERLSAAESTAQAERQRHAAEIDDFTTQLVTEVASFNEKLATATAKAEAAELAYQKQLVLSEAAAGQAKEENERLARELHKALEKLETAATQERALTGMIANAEAASNRLSDQLKDQKTRSAEVIGQLEKSKQALDAKTAEAIEQARQAAAALGRANGELEALRNQVGSMTETMRRMTGKPTDTPEAAPAKTKGKS